MKKLLLAAFIIIGLCGCEKDDSSKPTDPTQTTGKITHIDISGAKALYTTVSKTDIVRTKSIETTSTYALYKISADGTSSKIKVEDENGNEIVFLDSKVFPANENLIAFNFNTINGHYEYYIRKNDGAVFEIPQTFWGQYDHAYYIPPYDKDQNIYITANENNNRPIYKIPYTLTEGIIANKLSGNYIVNQYFVDYNGIVYCLVENTNHLLCILPDGSKVLGEILKGYSHFTINNYLNGGLFYFDDNALKHVIIDPISKSFTYKTVFDIDASFINSFRVIKKDNMSIAFNKEKVLVIKSLENITEYSCNVNSVTDYDVHCTDNYLYWEKEGNIYRINLINGTNETIFNGNGKYIFYDYPDIVHSKIFVQSDDVIHFRARKLIDGTFIAGKIVKGTYSEEVADENSDNAVISFVQVQ